MLEAFTRHPDTVGESYLQHLARAWGFAAALAVGAVACLVHGLFPFLFETSASRRIRDLHARLVTQRDGRDQRLM